MASGAGLVAGSALLFSIWTGKWFGVCERLGSVKKR